jgi:hypothetical protein
MSKYTADDMPSIAQRLKEIEAEKIARINGISLEDAKPVEPPADIDWTGAYGMYTPVGQTYSGWVWDQSKLGWVKTNG